MSASPHPSRVPRPRAVAGLLALATALAACAESTPPAVGVWRPGDSLLEELGDAHVRDYPESNLPAPMRAQLDGLLRLRTAPIPRGQWITGRPVPRERWPAGYEPAADARPLRLWRYVPSARPAEGAPAPRILRAGREVTLWDALSGEPFPGELIWWDADGGLLQAVSEKSPVGVALEVLADPVALLGDVERRLLTDGRAPEPGELVRRYALGSVSRPGILLPAPARVAFGPARLEVDTLELHAAVADVGYDVRGELVVESEGASDGVTFAIDVEDADGRIERAWSRHVTVAATFEPIRIDLARWRGQQVTLHLVSEPGPSGSAHFDYAIWAGLRLRGEPERAPARPHVILVDVDTLRADRLGCYGAERETSPRLDAWAEREATIFTDAWSTAAWTLPSTASMLTGLAVHQHRVDRETRRVTTATPPIAWLLSQAAGYETWGWAEGGYVLGKFGFDTGFDVYDSESHRETEFDTALAWVEERRSERPFFLFLHTYLVHAPYEHDPRFEAEADYDGWLAGQDVDYDNVIEPFREGLLELDEPEREYLRRMYDAGIARLDELLGPFLERLDRLLADEPYLLILTSDHGEAFFEHGLIVHGQGLYQELLHVPLIVRFPDPRVGRDDARTSTLDVVPTILDYAGLPIPEHMPGRSLRAPAPAPPRVAQHSDESHAIQLGPWKLIRGRAYADQPDAVRHELFQLDDDPTEQLDRADAEARQTERLAALLDDFLVEYEPFELSEDAEHAMTADVAEALRELGYLGDG